MRGSMLLATKPGFCFGCRAKRVFTRGQLDSWACGTCGAQRALTVTADEANKGGVEQRFWGNVKVTPFCWPWVTPVKAGNEPHFHMDGIGNLAARCAFFFSRGAWPDGVAFRTCSNALCMKPDHIIDIPVADISKTLSRMGRLDNIKQKPRQLCRRGHRLVGHNAGVHKSGRYCRKCKNAGRLARYHARRKQLCPTI